MRLFVFSEKRLNLQTGQQSVSKKLGQPAEDVHVYSNKKRQLLAIEAPGSEKDKYVVVDVFIKKLLSLPINLIVYVDMDLIG